MHVITLFVNAMFLLCLSSRLLASISKYTRFPILGKENNLNKTIIDGMFLMFKLDRLILSINVKLYIIKISGVSSTPLKSGNGYIKTTTTRQ